MTDSTVRPSTRRRPEERHPADSGSEPTHRHRDRPLGRTAVVVLLIGGTTFFLAVGLPGPAMVCLAAASLAVCATKTP
jgi:hypothetical protein